MNGFKLVANPPSLVLVALIVAQLPQPASAQGSVTLIEGARVFLGDGETLAHGNVVIRDGRIARVANGARPRRVNETIAAQGKFVTSGLIDVWSTLASGPRAASGRTSVESSSKNSQMTPGASSRIPKPMSPKPSAPSVSKKSRVTPTRNVSVSAILSRPGGLKRLSTGHARNVPAIFAGRKRAVLVGRH